MPDTLLKWPGGKSREFAVARPAIPAFNQYVEPFLGGGAFFFHLRPQRALLNDVNTLLVGLYRGAQFADPCLRETINHYVSAWEGLSPVADVLLEPLLTLYAQSRETSTELQHGVETCLLAAHQTFCAQFDGFFGDKEQLWAAVCVSARSKFSRLPKLERDNDLRFDAALMAAHVETAVRAGAYTYFRDSFMPPTEAEEVANFYFLREFCYGSMFRFNKHGKFNIPYGGIGYNGKNFRAKAARLFAPQTQALFSGASLFNLDFRAFFTAVWPRLSQDTFCFLDPPYDTKFSSYDKFAFTKQDQCELANLFAKLPCKAMLIIKSTPFIADIYQKAQSQNPAIQIVDFEKTYTYNVRGRNARDVQHLMICNYPALTAASSRSVVVVAKAMLTSSAP